jgi:hypothetical protein
MSEETHCLIFDGLEVSEKVDVDNAEAVFVESPVEDRTARGELRAGE